MSDPIKIKPIAPSLTPSEGQTALTKKRPFPWPIALVFVVLIVAFIGFRYMPTTVTFQNPSAQSRENEQHQSVDSRPSPSGSPLPFQDIEQQQAQESAKVILREFATIQNQVERDQLGLAAHRQQYDAIIDAANAADTSFASREYNRAIEEYRDATNQLRDFVDAREKEFEQSFEVGYTALVERDLHQARTQLEYATQIKPHDPALESALERLKKLPEVNALLRVSARASLRGNYDLAIEQLIQARHIDPQTEGLDVRLRELTQTKRDADFSAKLTQAYAALNANQLEAAKQGFESALRTRPDDTATKTGLDEVANRLNNAHIRNLKANAEKQERAGDWHSAQETFTRILEIDNNLQFARNGHERIRTALRLTAAMDQVLADPGQLSSSEAFDAAQQTLVGARGHDLVHQHHRTKIDQLSRLIETASTPLRIVFVSDNEMEVRLATVGDLGPFDRKVLSLRPGRYLLTGSANGCRDVRKTIVVEAGMEPISIVCNEPI